MAALPRKTNRKDGSLQPCTEITQGDTCKKRRKSNSVACSLGWPLLLLLLPLLRLPLLLQSTRAESLCKSLGRSKH